MNLFRKIFIIGLSALVFWPSLANAGLFDDDEARKAILDLRTKLTALTTKLETKLEEKADKSSALSLQSEIEQIKADIANLRGQIEVVMNDINNIQKRQQDFYNDLDKRLRALEPKKLNVDGKDVSVDVGEQKAFDAAMALYKAGQYANAAAAFNSFNMNYSDSAYASQAQYWLGNSYYAQRDCKNTITALNALLKKYPDNNKSPDAMLNIASCYLELKDKKNSRRYLDEVMKKYPGTEAAQAAKNLTPLTK